YNGPAYKQNAYDAKLATAYARYAAGSPKAAMPLLKRGSKGTAVADLQHDLTALGYPLSADGIFGPATVQAVRAFQRDHALAIDGIGGARTNAAIAAALRAPGLVGKGWRRLKDWLAGLFGRS